MLNHVESRIVLNLVKSSLVQVKHRCIQPNKLERKNPSLALLISLILSPYFGLYCIVNNKSFEARSHGLVVKGEDSQLTGCGFESWHHILDGCKRC